jgi:hypothetical protein
MVDVPRYKTREHPYDRPWLVQTISLLSFSWMLPMLKIGRRRQLVQDDMFPLPKSERASKCVDDLETRWAVVKARGGSFIWAAITTYPVEYAWITFFYVGDAALRVVQAYLGQFCLVAASCVPFNSPGVVGQIVKLIQDDESTERGLYLATGMTVANLT